MMCLDASANFCTNSMKIFFTSFRTNMVIESFIFSFAHAFAKFFFTKKRLRMEKSSVRGNEKATREKKDKKRLCEEGKS